MTKSKKTKKFKSVSGCIPLAGDNTTMAYRNGKFYIYSGYSPKTGKLLTQTWVSSDLVSWNKKKNTVLNTVDKLSLGYTTGTTNMATVVGEWFIFKGHSESVDGYAVKKPGQLFTCGAKQEYKNGAVMVRENGKIYTMTYYYGPTQVQVPVAVILAMDVEYGDPQWKVVNVVPVDDGIAPHVEDAMLVVNSENNTMTLLGGVRCDEAGPTNVPNFNIVVFSLSNALYE